ncbi:hypothetical protein HMI54_015466 [Coelomomyces lativittatus]|nr:hypothetical protein HMI54_015466 [Coelomomyces lativittatus]
MRHVSSLLLGIYPTFLHPSLQGYRFTHVVQNLYRVLGVFMVAWQRTSPHGLKLELFGSYPLACVQGNEPVYVIASHPTLANQVALMDDSQMQPIQFTESSSCWLPLPMAMDFPSFHRRRSFHSSRFKNAHSPPHPSSVGFPASYPGERMGTQDASSVPVHGKGRDLSLHRFHTVDGSQRYASTFSHEHEQPHFYGVYQHEDEGESEDGDESLMVKPEQEEKEEEEEECKNGNRKANEAQSFTLCTTNTNNVTPGTCLLTPLMMHEPTLDLSTSLPLTDVPTSSSSTEPHPTWEHHILICSTALTKFPSHLDVLVNILRHQQPYTPIVILSPVTPEKTMQFNLCSVFSSSCGGGGGGGGYGASSAFKHQVFHVIGNPLNIVDLHRSGAEKVARVVVLADESTKLKESSNDLGDRNGQRETEKTEDANVIMTLFNLKAVCRPNVFIVVEFIHNETMRFLTESDIHTASEKDAIEEIIPFLSPSFMAGNVFTVSMLDAMLSQAYHQPYFIPFWQSLLLNTPMGVHVYQVGLPPFLRNKPFYELVHYFLNHHLLVLGLFRSHPTLHQRYVILAPSSHVLVLPEDRVFVLGQNQYWENEPPEETHGIKKIKKERSCE